MANDNKKGFKTIEVSSEELAEKAREHRKKTIKRAIQIVVGVLLVVVVVELLFALRSYDSYTVQDAIQRSRSGSAQYAQFQNYLLEYSKDGISCRNNKEVLLWNQSFEMVTPKVEVEGDYLVVYDAGGTQLFLLKESGLIKKIETNAPIQTVCLAEQGTVAVLMKEDQEAQVKLFDTKGVELANGTFYVSKGGFPVDIALSQDATKLAVSLVDVSQGRVDTTIAFYNFGSVGQSEIDNNVGMFTFEGIVIPEIDYMSGSKLVGIGTGRILIFDGGQKPEIAKEIKIEQEMLSVFHNDKYVGYVYDNKGVENSWHIKVLDLYGNAVMENDTSLAYEKVEFLSNNEICVTNKTQCEIFTLHSIKKFSYTFENELYQILSESRQGYTLIFKDTIEKVILK